MLENVKKATRAAVRASVAASTNSEGRIDEVTEAKGGGALGCAPVLCRKREATSPLDTHARTITKHAQTCKHMHAQTCAPLFYPAGRRAGIR